VSPGQHECGEKEHPGDGGCAAESEPKPAADRGRDVAVGGHGGENLGHGQLAERESRTYNGDCVTRHWDVRVAPDNNARQKWGQTNLKTKSA
jgi:hypothetical protein